MSKKLLDAAVQRGFLHVVKEGHSDVYELAPMGMKMRRNLIRDWIRSVQTSRLRFNCQTGGLDEPSALIKAVKHHVDTLRHVPPFYISFNIPSDEEDQESSKGPIILRDRTFINSTKHDFYYICSARRSRLCFDQLLRQRQTWWSEVVRPDSFYRFQPSPLNRDGKAVRVLPYMDAQKEEAEDAMRPNIEVIEEIPEIVTSASTVSAIRNEFLVEAAMITLLEDGMTTRKNQEEVTEFRLHRRLTPYPIALFRRILEGDVPDVVQALCSKVEGILREHGLDYVYHAVDEETLEDQWRTLKASGVLYGVIIDGNVLRDGIVRFLHHDLGIEVETALHNLRQELHHRLGRPQKRVL